MEIKKAIPALSALAQESRLKTFRLLVKAGAKGMPAGAIADVLAVPQNTLSAHLSILANSGLIKSRRESRSIFYAVDFRGTQAMLGFLLEDCCQGSPKLCRPAITSTLKACCANQKGT